EPAAQEPAAQEPAAQEPAAQEPAAQEPATTPMATQPTASTPSLAGSVCPDIGLDAARVHYVCDCQAGADANCEAGDDSAEGTIDAPFRTYARAQQAFRTLGAGETIAFCRGGSFAVEGDRRWVNASCRANEPCVVRDYAAPGAPADAAKPILTTSEGNAFSFEDGAAADHEEGYVFMNLDVRSRSGGSSGDAFFFYNDIDDVLICGTSIDGFRIGVHAAGSNAPAAGSDGKNARIVVRNATITNNGDQGYLGGCDGCGVEHSVFENNGFNLEVLNHNIYFGPRGVKTMFARHNRLYKSAIVNGKCEGASLVVHGSVEDLEIIGNDIREDVGAAAEGCWGIAVDTGYAGTPEAFTNVVIRGNSVANVGNMGIGVNACKECVIENNVVVQEQPMETTLISVPDRSRLEEDQAMSAVKIRNNTLFARSTRNVVGIALGGEGVEHVAVSNALLSEGTGGFTCFSYDLEDRAYGARDNNLCHTPASADWATANLSLGAWNANTSADAASSVADPLFVSTRAPYDWTPSPGSPLLDAGHAESATSDFSGQARAGRADIGAFERR
ncbi:MAG TPA: choice-of-anchor Q domain-containing protein, partial [Polyangiaceae bacterium]